MPIGTLAIGIRDAFEAPVEGFEVEIVAVHMTIAAGETRETFKATTDADGNAYVRDLKVGSGHAYTVRATYKGSTFSVKDVRLDDRTGALVLLHIFEPTNDFMVAKTVGMNEITISHKEDFLVVNYAILYENPGPYALQLDHELVLPPGFSAVSSDDKQVPAVEPTDNGGRVKGTLRPGRHVIQFSFQVPMEEDGDQSFSVPMMPNIWTSEIRVTASKQMGLEVSGYSATTRTYDGQASWLETSRELKSLREGFIPKAEIRLTGLPTRPLGAWIAVVLGGLAVIGGGVFALRRRSSKAAPTDTIEDLLEAQQTLLDEFVALERAKQRGDIGPKSYARVRQAMLDALARIVERLEALGAAGTSTDGEAHAEKVRSDRKKSAASVR